jgi:hypothetical protein
MIAEASAALVQQVRNPFFRESERRGAERHLCSLEVTSHKVDEEQPLSFGAVVTDVSATGVSVKLCFPFRPGTFLAIDLQTGNNMVRTLMVRVQHVHDLSDGQWRLGCEFVKPLTESDMDLIL